MKRPPCPLVLAAACLAAVASTTAAPAGAGTAANRSANLTVDPRDPDLFSWERAQVPQP